LPAGLSEYVFASLFGKLVYAQIWEDPEIDMEALAIAPGDHVVTIASGGCNALSYLLADPARVEAVDLFAGALDLRSVLGESFVSTYAAIKRAEFETFMEVISPWEREYLLLNV
jgi:S-adenosylmethionine:diacylglycerol 3-amino-3-carboxypropyl transferase